LISINKFALLRIIGNKLLLSHNKDGLAMSLINITVNLLVILGSYLLGSIPPSYLVGRFKYGVDIRKQGSGNVGGANTARLFGKKIGLLVGLFDVLKGTAVVYIAAKIAPNYLDPTGFFSSADNIIAAAGLFAVLGHCFSAFLKFSGGKGGATTAGVALALDPMSFLIIVAFWFLIVSTTRFTSLGNLLTIILVPLLFDFAEIGSAYVIVGYLLIALIFYTHRANIGRLIQKNERKFGQKETVE
jgi:glycerol-3-phosphate acyltransferase PlsY